MKLSSAKLHRICVERETGATLHPQEPDPVQALGLRHLPGLRVHRLRRHHAQHPLLSHEVLPTTQGGKTFSYVAATLGNI